MELILDIGNSRTKLAVFQGGQLIRKLALANPLSELQLSDFLGEDSPDRALISATGVVPEWLENLVARRPLWIHFDTSTRLPFPLAYRTPDTLGRDRLAGVAGALALGYAPPLLVIDAGTCITVDLLDREGIFRGGSIAPGIRMRLDAMHHFTAQLPLAPYNPDIRLPGTDTADSLAAGAQLGAVAELEGLVRRYTHQFGNLNVVLTGGDQDFLASHLNVVIFAHPDLVLIGLHQILSHHADAG